MRLDDVAAAMAPAAGAALDKGLTFQEALMAMRISLVQEARKRSENNYRAAVLLKMGPGYFNDLISHRSLKKTSFRRGSRTAGRTKTPAPEPAIPHNRPEESH